MLRLASRMPLGFPEDRLLRLQRQCIASFVPIPDSPGEYAALNRWGRPVPRNNGPRGPGAAPIGRRYQASDLDLQWAHESDNGMVHVFSFLDAPWLSKEHEREYQRRIELILRRRAPTEADYALQRPGVIQ